MTQQQAQDFTEKLVSTTWKKVFTAITCTVSLMITMVLCTAHFVTIVERNNATNNAQNVNISRNSEDISKLDNRLKSNESRISENEYDILKLQYKIK